MTGYKDYYKILGVSQQDSLASINKAYRKLAKATHPDSIGDVGEVWMKELNDARDVLRDPKKRADFDLEWRKRNPAVHQATSEGLQRYDPKASSRQSSGQKQKQSSAPKYKPYAAPGPGTQQRPKSSQSQSGSKASNPKASSPKQSTAPHTAPRAAPASQTANRPFVNQPQGYYNSPSQWPSSSSVAPVAPVAQASVKEKILDRFESGGLIVVLTMVLTTALFGFTFICGLIGSYHPWSYATVFGLVDIQGAILVFLTPRNALAYFVRVVIALSGTVVFIAMGLKQVGDNTMARVPVHIITIVWIVSCAIWLLLVTASVVKVKKTI